MTWYVIDRKTNLILEERNNLNSCECEVIDKYNKKDIRITSAKVYHTQYGKLNVPNDGGSNE